MSFSHITRDAALDGVEPEQQVTVVATLPLGPDTLTLVYRTRDGALKERMISVADLATIRLATSALPFAFDGDGADFCLVCEAKRMDFAFLFDPMMAVHTSAVEPLPHQITAVYESMLPRTPLRYILADDPGAGKTIMAGLYIRELLLRADAHRILIVAPGSLVEQWREEMHEKFNLNFQLYSSLLEQNSPSGNPFDDYPLLIARLDQLARNEELRQKAYAPGWDLVVFDEAHKLAAHYAGQQVSKTARYRFAEDLSSHTRHLLLMTATPHNGHEADFQLFLALLDGDRFYGKFRNGVHKVDPSDLMRRMVKEELVKFDGTPLFPERRAYTVNYTLSPQEAALYADVTDYVKTEMGKAEQLTGARKGSVGFALTTLQRRLASSPEAIYQSLRNRHDRLTRRRDEAKLNLAAPQWATASAPDDDDDLSAAEQETLEEELVDAATTAQTVADLEVEIAILHRLMQQAHDLLVSGQDRKWDELSQLLQHDPAMRDAAGSQRKLIIFSEHRATLDYLLRKITGVLGSPAAVITIHGGTHRDERRHLQTRFRSDPDVRVLIATDAAGEGVNLQNANLMLNYDLPWNPNRLEQRFGRIHRIGQTEVCHLWNLVAKETREGEVYHRLLKKLEAESSALKGRVFDILGEVFEEASLKTLLMDAIRYGDDPAVRARLTTQIDHALDHDHILNLLHRNALAQESMTPDRLFAVKEEMEKAAARRLQPYFVHLYFQKAFAKLGGSLHPREQGRFEITHVPSAIRERDRRLPGPSAPPGPGAPRARRQQEPVITKYQRICFSREAIAPAGRTGLARADLMHPGHPLMLAMTDLITEQHGQLLRQGAILVDPADTGVSASLIFLISHEVKSGAGDETLSKRLHFVRVDPQGQASFAGWAPHLDLEPLDPAARPLIQDLLHQPWLTGALETRAVALAATTLAPDHYQEVATRRISHVNKTLDAVHSRLTAEIRFWEDRWLKLKEDVDAGRTARINLDNITRTLNDLRARLDSRKRDLQAMRHITSATPVVLGAALVIPAGLLAARRGDAPADPADAPFTADAAARAYIERKAMDAVRQDYEARGYRIVDVSAEKCGWDLTAYPPPLPDGRLPASLHIEVKGRVHNATTVTITRNEILTSYNQADQFVLALVLVGPEDLIRGPYYRHQPLPDSPSSAVSTIAYDLRQLFQF